MTDKHACGDRCSWAVDARTLRGWGYEIADLARDATAMEKANWGKRFGILKHQAWAEGRTRLCTNRPERKAPPDTTPASRRIRIRSVKNVPTERLHARLDYLRGHIARSAEWAEQKSDFKARVREIVAVEDELTTRNEAFEPLSRRGARPG